MSEIILDVQNLKKYFPIRRGIFSKTIGNVKAVDDVSFKIKRGETLGLVGESVDLPALELAKNLAFHLCAFHVRRAELHSAFVRNHQHFAQSHLFPRLRGNLVYFDNVVLLDFILLTTSSYDGVHL